MMGTSGFLGTSEFIGTQVEKHWLKVLSDVLK